MPHSFGYRSRTRSLFSRAFRTNGRLNTTPFLTTYKVGDYVDIVVKGNIHKGMPHRIYSGKTGKVYNITPRAVGVAIEKAVGHRKIVKRFHVRIEHVQKSKCQQEFETRKKINAEIAKFNQKNPKNKKPGFKRIPQQPRPAHTVVVKGQQVQTVAPVPYVDIY